MVGKEEEGTGSSPVPLSIHISQSSVTCNNALEIKPLNCNSSKSESMFLYKQVPKFILLRKIMQKQSKAVV